jgi:hypothetical protein
MAYSKAKLKLNVYYISKLKKGQDPTKGAIEPHKRAELPVVIMLLLIYTLWSSLQQPSTLSPLCLHQSLPGDGFCASVLSYRLATVSQLDPCSSQSQSQNESHITTDSQSASPSWCQAPIWDPRPIFLSP